MEQVHVEPFKVIGVPVRTSNKYGKSVIDIGLSWLHFEKDGLFYKIPNKTSDNMHIIYTDHEPGDMGEYTAIICCEVSSLDVVPVGMVGREFPGGEYVKHSVHGMVTKEVASKWKEIWEQDALTPRIYTTDFEIYKNGYPLNIGEVDVDIYIARNS